MGHRGPELQPELESDTEESPPPLPLPGRRAPPPACPPPNTPPHSVLSAPRAHRLALRALDPSHFGGSEDRPSLSQAAPITPNPLIEVPRIGSAPMSRSRLAAEPSRLWKLRQQALAL